MPVAPLRFRGSQAEKHGCFRLVKVREPEPRFRCSGFSIKPGDNVKITAKTNDPEALPNGELVIEPDWPGHNKDAMVTLDLKERLHGILRVIGLLGLVLIAFGLIRIRTVALKS